MIKVRKGNGIILGLSEENIKSLKDNQPIKFNLGDIIDGDPRVVYIIAGKTDDSMLLSIKRITQKNDN